MTVNFTTISFYELLALIISIIAVIIPIVQWAWRKFVVKPVLKYYPTGDAFLYINKSGSYIRLNGVFEAINKPVSVKDVSLQVTRKRDNRILNYKWSVFISPVNQQFIGAYTQTSEVAHPFRIESDSVYCAFVEFADPQDTATKKLAPYFKKLQDKSDALLVTQDIDADLALLRGSNEYKDTENALKQELFWEVGDYDCELTVKYQDKEQKYRCSFRISGDQYDDLTFNITEMLDSYMNGKHGKPYNFHPVKVLVK